MLQLTRVPLLLFSLLAVCTLPPHRARASAVPRHDHVIVVIMENKTYDQVRTQPYTAKLIASGVLLAGSHGVTHPSQPNYFALWAGSTLGVTDDRCPAPGSPFAVENLGHACAAAGLTWRAYSESLPSPGAAGCAYGHVPGGAAYTRKHDPWTCFANVDHRNARPYGDLVTDLAKGKLPNLAFIIPDNCHNTHNSASAGCGIADGDAWLAANLPPVIRRLGPRGCLILTWDEDDGSAGNQILTVLVGPRIRRGAVTRRAVTHYTVLRTICDMLGLPALGLAAAETPITGIWSRPRGGAVGVGRR